MRIVVERASSGKEFYTLAQITDVDFKPRVIVFLLATTTLLVPLKFFTSFCTTNKSAYIFR